MGYSIISFNDLTVDSSDTGSSKVASFPIGQIGRQTSAGLDPETLS
jgi:hypothetical protein